MFPVPLKGLLVQCDYHSVFPIRTDAFFLSSSEWRKHEAACTDTCSWGVALAFEPAPSVTPQVYGAVSIGDRHHKAEAGPQAVASVAVVYRKHLFGSCFCSRKGLLSHATCFLVCFCSGKSNPYCEISMGSQSYTTRTLQDTLNPKWNFNCQFFIKDLYQDVLCLTMFDRDQFSPDGKV